MNAEFSHLLAYIRALDYRTEKVETAGPKPVLTLSRQRGARGRIIAQKTAAFLSKPADQPWVVIDRNLAQRVMEDHHLSAQLCRFLTDEQALSVREQLERKLRHQPSKNVAVEKMTQTMLRLAEIGHMIFLGRAAHVVMVHHPRACHVRVIGSFPRRVRQVMADTGLAREAAEAEVCRADRNRAHFARSCFHTDIDDPARYQLVLNTDDIDDEKAVRLIADLVHSEDPRRSSHPGRMAAVLV